MEGKQEAQAKSLLLTGSWEALELCLLHPELPGGGPVDPPHLQTGFSQLKPVTPKDKDKTRDEAAWTESSVQQTRAEAL